MSANGISVGPDVCHCCDTARSLAGVAQTEIPVQAHLDHGSSTALAGSKFVGSNQHSSVMAVTHTAKDTRRTVSNIRAILARRDSAIDLQQLTDLETDSDGHSERGLPISADGGCSTERHSNEDIWNAINTLQASLDQLLSMQSSKVKKPDPADRDPTVMPLITSKADGTVVTLWAKIDTGASENYMSLRLVQMLQREAEMRTIGNDGEQVKEIDGRSIVIEHYLPLVFLAGHHNKKFSNQIFNIFGHEQPVGAVQIAEDQPSPIPDILLGMPFLKLSHALMTDYEYENDPFPDFPELLPKPEEGADFLGCNIRHPTVPSTRPARPRN